MNKIKILLVVLVVAIGLPAIALGGSFTVSLIQGKTPNEAIKIILEQIDSLIVRVGLLETKQSDQEKVLCGLSFKEVPRGSVYGVNISENIVKYYTVSKFVLDNKLVANQDFLPRVQETVNEAGVLYTAFIKGCPDYPTVKISAKAQWCMAVENVPKCFQLYGKDRRPASEDEQFLGAKYLEFNCEQVLSQEAPDRTKYECG